MKILCWEIRFVRRRWFEKYHSKSASANLVDPLSARSDDANVTLDDLARRPSVLDSDLETNLQNWENAIHEYREYEDLLVEEDGEDGKLISILNELRVNPESFLSGYAANIEQLAAMRCAIYSCQARLGLSREAQKPIQPPNAVAPRPRARPSDPLVQIVANSNQLLEKIAVQKRVTRMPGQGRGSYSESVSQKWAERLTQIDPTQGSFKIAPTAADAQQSARRAPICPSKNEEILPKIQPRWPQYLSDTWYDVIKVSKLGIRQRRQLKLTEYHILSIKGGKALSKIYLYMEVGEICLQNSNMAVLTLRNAKQLCFLSPIAATIVQQITARVQVRIALEKTVYFTPARTGSVLSSSTQGAPSPPRETCPGRSADFNSTSDQPAPSDSLCLSFSVTQQLIESISQENDEVSLDVLAQFATSLRDRALTKGAAPHTSSKTNTSPKHLSEKRGQNTRPLKLLALVEGSPEQVVQDELLRMLHDCSTPEGNTRQVFMDEFIARDRSGSSIRSDRKLSTSTVGSSDGKSLVDLRHFVEGLHEYVLQTRGAALSALLLSAGQECTPADAEHGRAGRNSSNANRSSANKTAAWLSTSAMGRLTRARNSSISDVAVNATRSSDSRAGPGTFRRCSNLMPVNEHEDDDQPAHWSAGLLEQQQDVLSYLVFSAVEESLFLPLKDELALRFPAAGTDDCIVEQFMETISTRTQEEMNIESDHVSALGWETAVFELAGVGRAATPSMQLMSLVRACKAIYAEFKQVVVPRLVALGKPHSACLLGADGLVPIFIFVLCRSKLKRPTFHKELLWTLCHPDQLQGECGYFLTVFESSISFLLQEATDGEGGDGRLKGGRLTVSGIAVEAKGTQKGLLATLANKVFGPATGSTTLQQQF